MPPPLFPNTQTFVSCRHLANRSVLLRFGSFYPLSTSSTTALRLIPCGLCAAMPIQDRYRPCPTASHTDPHQHQSALQHLNPHRAPRTPCPLSFLCQLHEIQTLRPYLLPLFLTLGHLIPRSSRCWKSYRHSGCQLPYDPHLREGQWGEWEAGQ